MPNAIAMVTSGNKAPQVDFPSSVSQFRSFARPVLNVHNSICLVYGKLNGMDCRVWSNVIAFAGAPLALQCFVHVSGKKLLQ